MTEFLKYFWVNYPFNAKNRSTVQMRWSF